MTKKKLLVYALMWITATIITFATLKLANTIGEPWINVSWAMGVWFGMETILFSDIIKDCDASCIGKK